MHSDFDIQVIADVIRHDIMLEQRNGAEQPAPDVSSVDWQQLGRLVADNIDGMLLRAMLGLGQN